MAERLSPTSFDVTDGQPLIAVPLEENGQQIVRYFTDEAAADTALAARTRRDVRHLAGVWQDLDWATFAVELDRLRHERAPTPPINL